MARLTRAVALALALQASPCALPAPGRPPESLELASTRAAPTGPGGPASRCRAARLWGDVGEDGSFWHTSCGGVEPSPFHCRCR